MIILTRCICYIYFAFLCTWAQSWVSVGAIGNITWVYCIAAFQTFSCSFLEGLYVGMQMSLWRISGIFPASPLVKFPLTAIKPLEESRQVSGPSTQVPALALNFPKGQDPILQAFLVWVVNVWRPLMFHILRVFNMLVAQQALHPTLLFVMLIVAYFFECH